MSAPGQEFRESEYLGLGMLAVTSSGLIDRILSGAPIDDDDRYTLSKAKDFLHDLSSGAKLVTSGVASNVSAADSVRKLAYAVEPLSQIQKQLKSADLGAELDRVADSLEHSLAAVPGPAERADLAVAKDFFQMLQSILLGLVEVGNRRTGELASGLRTMQYA
jgi:hypothetical protein